MIGRVLGGRYAITESIDVGGMALIYKALCKKTGRFVAVKVLKDKFSDNAEYVNRFKKEASAAFLLEHDNIVRVTDIGCDEGVYYMVMEYVEGRTLKSLIDMSQVIEEKEAIQYAIQVCSALSAAHKRGIIHRDIKPQNILIDADNNAKVTDFGIAKSLSARHETESQVIGSVYYVSPEQARGESVDARTDIYSLGIMLYEMTTGELPYTGDQTVSVALKHINEQITPPVQKNPALSASINKIILKTTSKNKRDRYRSMDALRDDLVRALVNPSGDFIDLPYQHPALTANLKQLSRKFKIWKICVLMVLVLGVALAAWLGIDAINRAASELLSVPYVVGRDMDTATQELTEMGFIVTTNYESSNLVPLGNVIAQMPLADSQTQKGAAVTLTVSSGTSDLLMPDVYDLSLDEAAALIEQMGLTLDSVSYEVVADVVPGHVIAQSPDAGSIVTPEDSVSLIVSGESEPTGVVPPTVGTMLGQAIPLLYDTGFSNCFVYEQESDLPAGTVTAQSPEQGIQTPLASEVTLWISAYTDKQYSGSFSATVNITEEDSILRIIVEDMLEGRSVRFAQEMQPEVGMLPLNMDIKCLTAGQKTVRILLNNVEISSTTIDVK